MAKRTRRGSLEPRRWGTWVALAVGTSGAVINCAGFTPHSPTDLGGLGGDGSGGRQPADGDGGLGNAGHGGAGDGGSGDDGAGGLGNSGGSAGSGGGTGGAPPASNVGTLGEPCAPNGALGCAGHAKKGQLVCVAGEWSQNGTCPGSNNCDTSDENAGSCQPILTECLGAEAGDEVAVCAGNLPQVCGVDLTTLEDGDPCPSDHGCADGVCEPVLPECEGKGEGDAVCSDDGNEAFECGENLLTKENVDACEAVCSAGACINWPSCVGLAESCGPGGDDDCCESPLVSGGTFYRGTTTDFLATISSFRLDKYEVTVGRFRKFVAATEGGWLPAAGSGKHTHVAGGAGLTATAGGHEPGWDADWNHGDDPYRMYSGAGATDDWNASLACQAAATWTAAPGANEVLPINCVNWYQSAAFCIWDGGFLPSEAEREYAEAGGAAERTYPWGNSGLDCTYANYSGCLGAAAPAGSLSPKGDGLFGQSDLMANLAEWYLDWYAALGEGCLDCANTTPATNRLYRGGYWGSSASDILMNDRDQSAPTSRAQGLGIRCARSP